MKMRVLLVAARVVVGMIFVLAALPKIVQPHEFAVAVFRYRLLPDQFVNAAAILMPWVELTAGLCLLLSPSPAWRAAGALIILALLAVFTAAIAVDLHRGLDIACGCFSLDPRTGRIGMLSLARNTILAAATAAVLVDALRADSPRRRPW